MQGGPQWRLQEGGGGLPAGGPGGGGRGAGGRSGGGVPTRGRTPTVFHNASAIVVPDDASPPVGPLPLLTELPVALQPVMPLLHLHRGQVIVQKHLVAPQLAGPAEGLSLCGRVREADQDVTRPGPGARSPQQLGFHESTCWDLQQADNKALDVASLLILLHISNNNVVASSSPVLQIESLLSSPQLRVVQTPGPWK